MAGTPNVTISAAVAPPRAGDLTSAIEIVEPIIGAIAEDVNGEPLSPVRWVICEDFATEVTVHLDPSGAATYRGVPVKVVSERLGHANPAFTITVYQHIIPGMQADAATVFSDLVAGVIPAAEELSDAAVDE